MEVLHDDMRMEEACSESPDALCVDRTFSKPEVQISFSVGVSISDRLVESAVYPLLIRVQVCPRDVSSG